MCKSCDSATTCESCGHSSVIHNKKGACHGRDCLCGWTRDMSGALHYKSTGERADEATARKRNKGARVNPRRRDKLLKIPCYYCGEKAESIDHLIARAKGGGSGPSNLVSACHLCNGMKGDKSYEEFIEFCRHLETSTRSTNSLRKKLVFETWKGQAKKVLDCHLKREIAKA